MQCRNCGHEVESWQKFCTQCGAAAPRRTYWTWGGAMAALLMLAGFLGYRIYSLERQPADISMQTPAPAPAEPAEAAAPEPPPPQAAPVERASAPARPGPRAVEPVPAPPAPETKAPEQPAARRLRIPKDFETEGPLPPAANPAAPAAASPARPAEPEGRTSIPVVPAPASDGARARPPTPDGRTPIPIVPAPQVSTEPIERIGILRPERSSPASRTPAPARPEPAPDARRDPAPAAAPAYQGPSAGTLIWSGQIEKETLVTISGGQVSLGRLTGELPGVPVRIELETDAFAIVEPPNPANGWKRLSLRSLKSVRSAVVIKWILL